MPRHADPRLIAVENRAFLRALAATGNVREAARRIGRAYGKAIREAAWERERDKFRIAEAVRHARGQETYLPWEPPVVLPDLAQVTGWSRARESKVHDERRALFGGWRIEDMERKRDEG